MIKSKIIIIGSSNTDMVMRTDRFPKPGETVLGGSFLMNPGGKGANQAVSAARLGGQVVFITSVGDDMFGKQALQSLTNEGVDSSYSLINPEKPSGIAMITVDQHGENNIVVAPGANNELLVDRISGLEELLTAENYVLMQLEIPLQTVEEIAFKAHQRGVKVILNPAPAQPLPKSLFHSLYLITPNESEASLLTGIPVVDIPSAKQAAQILRDQGVQQVVITLGAQGALALVNDEFLVVEPYKVSVLDTTAAGDVFNGALAVALSEDMPFPKALNFASLASAISVTRLGAQASAPYRKELASFF